MKYLHQSSSPADLQEMVKQCQLPIACSELSNNTKKNQKWRYQNAHLQVKSFRNLISIISCLFNDRWWIISNNRWNRQGRRLMWVNRIRFQPNRHFLLIRLFRIMECSFRILSHRGIYIKAKKAFINTKRKTLQ